MNYQDFGEGKRIDAKKLQELVDSTQPTELRGIVGFWKNFMSNDILAGLVCVDERLPIRKGIRTWENISKILWGDILVLSYESGVTKRASGLYLIEGVNTGYCLDKNGRIYAGDSNFIVSDLALPTDKFIPLYVNMYQNLGIMPPPMEFGRVD